MIYGSTDPNSDREEANACTYLRQGLKDEPVFFITVFLAAIVQAMQSIPSLAVTYYLKVSFIRPQKHTANV